jgi:putative transposase
VEARLRNINQRAIRRGSFSSIKTLIANIESFIIANYNKGLSPLSWKPTADLILEKLQRLRSHIFGL